MLSKEQVEQIKRQIISQIDSSFPESKKSTAIEQVLSMDNEQLEEFLAKNNLMNEKGGEITENNKTQNKQEDNEKSKCIFCSIANKEIPSHYLDENKQAIAVLEINPLSKGHLIIIPKKHLNITEIPSQALLLAKKFIKRIKSKLKPEEVKIETSGFMGHGIVNVVPLYKNSPPNKYKASEKELQELEEKLKVKIKKKIEKRPKVREIKDVEKLWLPRRIP